jgi:hypothetical protein
MVLDICILKTIFPENELVKKSKHVGEEINIS